MQYPVNDQSLTMTSREIAEVTGKQHQHVKRDIEKMLEDLQEDVSIFGRIYLDSMNRKQIEYVLDREHTECLVTGYSAFLPHIKQEAKWAPIRFTTSSQVSVLAHSLQRGSDSGFTSGRIAGTVVN